MLVTADRLALTDLVHRYAACIDSLDLSGAAELFTHDGALVVPRPPESYAPIEAFEGRDAIESLLRRVLTLDGTVHEITGHVIDLDPTTSDRAWGRTACVAHHFFSAKDDQWHMHYDDEYVRTAGGWRFARRAYTIDSMRLSDVRHPRPAEG